ncbi:hypothetical protein SUNI508_08581 [Seiridium unicorne]|uniref:RING-type domain-containing protein n=1 Tax=Seiridium unicorne TaxID=138068 RepID=A0ABR2UTD9_9PEZI
MDHAVSKLATEPPSYYHTKEPIRKTRNILAKVLRRIRISVEDASSSDDKTCGQNIPAEPSISTAQPPTYNQMRILDGYKWPLREPIEILMTCDELWAQSGFMCQARTPPTCPDYRSSTEGMIALPCGHAFHPDCIHTQLQRYVYARCPTCQHTLHYRLCHHRVHIPYFAPGTIMHQDELDGACRSCAPFPFMQHHLNTRGPTSELPKSDRGFFDADFGWHWWILSVFEGGADRYLTERAVLLRRLFQVCTGQCERERKVAMVIFDTLRLIYLHLKAYKGIDWQHALRLVGSIAYEEASSSYKRTPEQRGVDIWSCLLHMMVESLHQFHLRGSRLWQPLELVPFEPYYPMLEDLTDGAV